MASQPTTSPTATLHNPPRPRLSRKELADLEREIALYLSFWMQARDGHRTQAVGGVR